MALIDRVAVSVGAGQTVSYQHSLGVVPDEVFPDRSTGLKITATTATTITVNNPTSGALSAVFYPFKYHSIVRDITPSWLPMLWQGSDSSTSSALADSVSVTDYGAVGDGVTDDVLAIEAAWAAAKAQNKNLAFPPPSVSYRVSRAAYLNAGSNITVWGWGGASISFPSADTSLVAGGNYTTALQKRSAFFIYGCTNVSVRDLSFTGQTSNVCDDNIGVAVCILGSTFTHLLRLWKMYGGSLVYEQPNNVTSTNYGTTVELCYSYANRGTSAIGHYSVFRRCWFEQPTTADYDYQKIAGITYGSTHGIYLNAGSGRHVNVIDCVFWYFRKNSVKISGTAFPYEGASVSKCKIYGSYETALLFGADDVQQHNTYVADGNEFYDTRGPIIQILGARSVNITNNSAYWTAAPPSIMSSIIDVTRYTTASQPVEDVLIANNVLDADPTIGNTLIATTGILLTRVGAGTPGSSVMVTNNTIAHCAAYGVQTIRCIQPKIVDNTFNTLSFAALFTGDRIPVWEGNTIINSQLNFPQIKFDATEVPSFPVIGRTRYPGKLGSYDSKPTIGDTTNTIRDWPILGYCGQLVTTNSHPEVVMAYGSDWTDGDTVRINGVVVATYKTTAPGAGEFNSPASLMALITAGGVYTATDYGAALASATTTNHIKIALTLASGVADLFYVTTTCANATAGVLLVNSTAGSRDRCYSRGEGVDRVVIWSPVITPQDAPSFVALNAAARTAMGAAGPLQIAPGGTEYNANACYVVEWAGLGGTEAWRWGLGM